MNDDVMERFRLFKTEPVQFRRHELNELRLLGVPALCFDLEASFNVINSRFDLPVLIQVICRVLIENGARIRSSCAFTNSRITTQQLLAVSFKTKLQPYLLSQFVNHIMLLMPRCVSNRALIRRLVQVFANDNTAHSIGYICIVAAVAALDLLLDADYERALHQILCLKSLCIWYESRLSWN